MTAAMRKMLPALAFVGLLVTTGVALAQAELSLELHRDFGFDWGGQIQGKFTLEAGAPEGLARVVFLLDGDVMGEALQAPYAVGFHTGDHALGWHTLSAEALTSDGRQMVSEELRREFVAADVGPKFAVRLAVPLLGIIAVLMVVFAVVPTIGGRAAFHLGRYGSAGGTVCRRCSLPFSRHLLSPILGFGRLERCPHCGRWSIVMRADPRALAEAEARFASSGVPTLPASDDDRLHQQIDDSRFLD
jgi:hypothetical protein